MTENSKNPNEIYVYGVHTLKRALGEINIASRVLNNEEWRPISIMGGILSFTFPVTSRFAKTPVSIALSGLVDFGNLSLSCAVSVVGLQVMGPPGMIGGFMASKVMHNSLSHLVLDHFGVKDIYLDPP